MFFLSLHSTWFSSYFSENLCLIFIITLHFSLTSIQCSYFIWSLSPLQFFLYYFPRWAPSCTLITPSTYIYHIHIFNLFYQASFTYSRTYLIASLKYLINTLNWAFNFVSTYLFSPRLPHLLRVVPPSHFTVYFFLSYAFKYQTINPFILILPLTFCWHMFLVPRFDDNIGLSYSIQSKHRQYLVLIMWK